MTNENIRKVITFFACKYKFNWENIYQAIKTKEPIEKTKLVNFKINDQNFITIIDDDYPNNFKSIYMPPFILFFKGNRQLLNQDQKIIAIWDNPNLDLMKNNKLSKDNIYVYLFKKEYISEFNKLINQNYKLILVANHFEKQYINLLKFNNNVVFISETSFSCKAPKFDVEQNVERIILGIAYKNLMLKKSIISLNFLWPLFKFENKNIYVSNQYDYSIEERKHFNLLQY